jgi:cytidylate kinase
MLIGIAGPTASGKTTVTEIFTNEYDAAYMRYSQILSDIASERDLDSSDKATLQNLYVSLRDERGENWLAQEIAERAKTLASEHLVIEGNRRKVDLDTLQEVAKARNEKLVFIFVDASPDTRFTRYNLRLEKQGKPPITRDTFTTLEQNPAEDEVNDLREYAKAHGIYIDTDEQNIEEVKKLVRSKLNI